VKEKLMESFALEIQTALANLAIAMEADNKTEILHQLEVLASLGRPQKYSSIAAAYEFGNINVTVRDDLAFDWYVKSAVDEDDCESYFSIGRFYFHGKHVEQSLEKSTQYYEIAHSKGSCVAGIMLAYRYLYGIGVPVDLDQAERYLGPALSNGYVGALALLFKIKFIRKQYFAGIKLWIRCVVDVIRLVFRDPHSPKLYALKSEQMVNEDIAAAQRHSLEWSKKN
jgi:TPR repeat protein